MTRLVFLIQTPQATRSTTTMIVPTTIPAIVAPDNLLPTKKRRESGKMPSKGVSKYRRGLKGKNGFKNDGRNGKYESRSGA